MEIFIVIPCLDEEENLAATCASLGFPGRADKSCHLVLVDNGSSDKTLQVMASIRGASNAGGVVVIEQPVRGYVPARSAGAEAVMGIVRSTGLHAHEVLVLQADADTTYLPGYVDQMQEVAMRAPTGVILEGSAVTPREFFHAYPIFDALSKNIDFAMEKFFVNESEGIVIDDKICGYRLHDYARWGGHRREYDSRGEEIYAETTRLYIRAKGTGGATRMRVEAATALPSRRKLLSSPGVYFATAGFPRSESWKEEWVAQHPGADCLAFLENPSSIPWLQDAIRARQQHELALFALLPVLINPEVACGLEVRKLFQALFKDGQGQNIHPLEAVLGIADARSDVLNSFFDSSARSGCD